MRQIKFRGKETSKPNRWMIGHYYEENGASFIWVKGEMKNWPIEVDAETVGQFTGWNPRKCGDLYEGDIIGFDDWAFNERERKRMKHHVGVIEWSDEYGKYQIKCKDGFYEGNDIADPQLLGNKYDNPELLKEINDD